MPIAKFELPDGRIARFEVPEGTTPEQAQQMIVPMLGTLPPPPPGVGEQLLGAPKAFVKGIGSSLATTAGGIAGLGYAGARAAFPELAPFSETAVGRGIAGAEEYFAPSDEGFVTQVAGGLGSLASILGPQVALRGLGAAGRFGGLAPKAATPVAVAQTGGLGAGEARQMVEVARGEGIEVTPGQELAALGVGLPIGLTELLPVERLFKGLGVGLDDGFKFTIANLVKRGFQQGGIEGAQEVAAGLMQDLSAKGIYNPNLEVGDSMLNEFAVGSTVGAIAQTGLDVLLRKDITAAYQNRLRRESEERLRKETDALREQEAQQIAQTKENLGIRDSQVLALPAPAPQVEDVEQVDPLMNPVGFFNANELTPEYLKAVNDIRTKEGKAKISQFSIEDLADAGAPQAEIDRLLTYKTGYDGTTKLNADDVFNIAQMKNVDVTTAGFADFLNRATGQADVAKMSQPQLFAAFKALDSLGPSETLQILPQGTNATRFTDTQYNKAIKSLTDMFPQTNLLGRSSVLQEIKDYTGLENDRDAESLLQTAIRKGDLDTVSTPRYDVVDPSGKTVRTYLTRDSAERAARKEGLSVRESTSINIALPGSATQLPGGPDIRRGTFKEGVAPAGFEIRSPDATLAVSKTQDEADAKAKRLEALRLNKAQGFLGQAAKVEQEMAKSNQKLESMEADGKADTIEYKQLAAKIAANNKNLQQQVDRLKAKANAFSQPLEIAPKGEKPVTREGYTLFQDGKPVATFPDQRRAEEAALATLSDEQIDGLIEKAPELKGLMPKRLRKMAIDEKVRRQQASEIDMTYGPRVRPIEVAFKGDRAAAEQRLREAGLNIRFSPEIQSRIDELDKQLRPLMERLGLKDVRLKIVDAIKTPAGEANASYVSNLITVALNADSPVRALRHEGVHALKELGFFTPQQWKVLEKKAREEWVSKYNIQSRYQTLGLNQDEILEEAIADAFSDFDQRKPPAGLTGALFNKVKNFLNALGNALRGLGFQTADDVFTRVEEGRLTGPAAGAARDGLKKFSIGRSSDPAINIITGETPRPNFGKKTTVEDVGNYFDGLIREEFGGSLDFRNPQHFDRAVGIALQELQYQRELENSGFDWYDKDIADAFEITAEVLPQLSNPVKRNLFNLIAGIMSPGVNARDNWVIAAKAFKHYVNTGTIPGLNPANNRLWQGGVQSATKRDQLNMLNAMVQDMGELGAVEWTYGSHPVSEINDFRSRYGGFTSKVSGKATSEKTGIDAFGPKVGPFIANINGIHAETVDRWMIRTFNRYFGTMVDANGNMLDAPTGEPQRRAAQELLRRVGDELGIRPYQAQSMLWFFEQSLFRAMGTSAPSYGFSDGARRYRDDAREGRGDEEGRGDGAPTDQRRPDTRFSLRSDELAGRPGAPGGTAERTGDRGRRDQGRSNTPLEGAPVVQGATGPDPNLVSIAERYAQENEIPYRRQGEYVEVDPQFGGRVARAYDAMIHDPQSPAVKEAYADLIRQTRAQYDALIDSGYRFTFYDSNTDPYDGNPFNAMRDLRANKRMAVYGTYDGYGTEGITGAEVANNPMLEDTGLRWPDQNGTPRMVTANDLFRAVHDAFGHGLEGAGFRARGEENAFQAHARLFTGPALGALASETRGQNSWLNFGPYGEQNANAKVLDTVFAEQKTGLMPSWTWTTNMAPDMVEPEVLPSIGEGISIRPQQPGAQSFDAVHYGKTSTNVLGGSFYGTGLKGAEAERLSYSTDPRIKRRAYFYIARPNGEMPKPEAGVGNQVHIQRLNNMLGPGAEMSALARASVVDGRFNENVFESSVIDAGYDGYALPADGMAVVLDANVPVIPRGTRQEVEAKPEKDKIKIGDRKYSLRQTNTKEFKDWFGDSTITNPDGSPKVMYHGTARDISEFRPKQANAIFVTDKPRFAESFSNTSEVYMAYELFNKTFTPEQRKTMVRESANRLYKNKYIDRKTRDQAISNQINADRKLGSLFINSAIEDDLMSQLKEMLPSGQSIMPLYVRAENPFDYENPQHIRRLAIAGIDDDVTLEEISEGNWDTIESEKIQEVIRDLFDGFYVNEGGVKNLAVYDPNQIKSAIGNFGTFSRSNDDIRYSLALEGLKPSSALIPDEGGNPSGNLGFMPEKLGGKPIRLLVGTHSDTVDELANEKMYRPVSYGGNHILNRIMSYPKREPIGAEELLEKIVRAAQKTSQTYTRIYKEGSRYILFDGKNSLILGENPDSMSIITMYTQADPNRRYGNPAWFGRAPVVPEFTGLIRGTKVEAKEGRIAPSGVEAKAKRVYTPSDIAAIAAAEPIKQPTKGTISLKQKLSLASAYDLKPVDTESKNFKTWFSGSMVRNPDGSPRVVYHGTQADIPYFDFDAEAQNRTGNPSGFYFTRSPEEASNYANKDVFGRKTEVTEGANVLPVYLSIVNPFNYSNNPEFRKTPVTQKMVDQFEKELRRENPDLKEDWIQSKMNLFRERGVRGGDPFPNISFSSAAKTRVLQAGGYDGMIDGPHFVAFKQGQIKSALSTTGNIDKSFPDIQYSVRDSIPADIVDAIDRTTTAREEKGFAERIADSFSPTAFTKFRQGMINKYESIERLSRAAAESPQDLLADQSAIAAALFADRAAGVAAASFGANDRVGGIPVYKNGFTQISNENNTVKGLIPIFEPLAKYGDPYAFQAFQYYAGTRRGKRLLAEGREKVFTPEDIKRGKLLEQQYPEFKQVFDDYQKYNEGIVKFLKDTGVLSDKEAEIWMQNADYIPFYRQMEGEEGGLVGPKVFSPIAGVAKPKKLKGGDAPLADFMETVVRNSRAAIEAGMKNVAGQRVIRDMLKLNQAEAVPVTAVGSDIVTVKEKGLTKHYRVEDPMLVEALKGLNLPQLPFLEILAKPSEVLRNLVTKDPGFMLANLTRDSLQAWVTTGVSMTPIIDTYKNFGKALANMSPEVKALANAGLFAGYDFSGDVKSSAAEVERALRERTGTRTTLEKAGRLTGLPQIWNALDKGSTASDVATRAEVYKKVLAETGNQAEAMYQAMEVLNFSRKGNSALIRVVTALVPFMNARIQGLDVLYRSGFGKMATATRERQQKAFITRGLTLFALSSLYWALASETEEYKTATPEARDNNWIIGSVRIPIPFEIGTIFKVFPERIYEYFFGMDTGRDLKESIVRNITSTLAFNPIPQAFLPAVENIANYSFFTGQPIVGRGMQDVAAPFQVTPSTSLLAQEVGEATGQSPMMIDNLIRGYTGTIGTYVVQALDAVMRGEDDPPKPAMTIEQFPVLKRFFASPQGSGTIDAYYDMKQRVDEATRTINFLERTGGTQDLQEYLSGKGGKLIMIKPYIQAMEKDMKSLREMRRAVQASQIDADQKRQILDSIRASEVAITSRVQFVKKLVD